MISCFKYNEDQKKFGFLIKHILYLFLFFLYKFYEWHEKWRKMVIIGVFVQILKFTDYQENFTD